MSRSRGKEQTPPVIFGALVFAVLGLDQLTKFLAVHHLSSVETVPVIPGIFHLTLVYNTGIAFGFFRQGQMALLGVITISLIVILVWGLQTLKKNKKNPLQRVQTGALALILGGAVGNWVDRVRLGAVVDFFDFRIWPVFNIADCAITSGVVFYLWLILFKEKELK